MPMEVPTVETKATTDIMPDKNSALRIAIEFKMPAGFTAAGAKVSADYHTDGTVVIFVQMPRA